MSLQARASEWDHRLYNVNRDVAHCFGDMMRLVVERLEQGAWEPVAGYLAEHKVSGAELSAAVQAYCDFVATAVQDKKENMPMALTRTGWFACRGEAQVAVMAVLGTVVGGYFFGGAKEATLQGKGPCNDLQDLKELGRVCTQLMAMPVWKRRLLGFWHRLGRAWRALRA